MTNALCIDEKYSTTRLLTKEKPMIENRPEDKFETSLFLPECENRKGEGGLRTKGYFKKSYEGKPLVSIVTVVFNGEKYLEETIQSVINQTYDNVEYIIIDGGSNDGTLDIIKKYEDQMDYWVSEQDNGVYDGMNKGIDVVSGKWINFMNAGDSFYDSKTLTKVFTSKLNGIDIVYGDRQVVYINNKTKIVKAQELKLIWQGKPMCHQSCFIDAMYHKKNKFILKYDICDDFEFIYSAYQKKANFKYINTVIAKYLIGGLSGDNNIKATMQDWMIIDKNTKVNLYYLWKLLKVTIKEPVRYILKYNVPEEQRNKFQNTIVSVVERFKKIS